MEILLWTLAVLAILVGIAGTVVPALPGAPLVFLGVLLAAWIDDFTKIGWVPLSVLGVLTILTFIIDFAASLLGAKRVGASKLAIVGAAVGSIVGIFAGLVGIFVFPFIGAVIGEIISGSELVKAGKVGIGTWIGLMVGTALKVGVALSMVGVFAASLIW